MHRFVFLFFLLFGISSAALAASGDGVLRLYHSHSKEYLDITYKEGNQYNERALSRLNHFLRSRADNKVTPINPKIIDDLDFLQDHFKVDTIELICGYRSPKFNKKLKSEGRNVAGDSRHMKGDALDFHFDEISEEQIVKVARSQLKGGVGYYPDMLMVHIDTGSKRFWQEGSFTNRLDITEKNLNISELKTNKLHYFPGDSFILNARTSEFNSSQNTTVVVEQFFRGKWRVVAAENWNRFEQRLDNLPFGKLRVKWIKPHGEPSYSNEFYYKRL